jgi:hypothetical protein
MAAGRSFGGWASLVACAAVSGHAGAGCALVEPIPEPADPAASCRNCAMSQCASQASACAACAPCGALEQGCLFGCNDDPACRSQCALDHTLRLGDGCDVAAPLDACLATNCANECGLTCGGLSQIADPHGAAACADCLNTKPDYCSLEEECAKNPACQQYLHCRQGCVTGDCIGACIGIGTSFFGFYNSIEPQCRVQCEVGANWGCVGRIQWLPAEYETRTLTFHLADYFFGTAETGVTVAMCEADDVPCATPVSGPVMLDSMGYATLAESTPNAQHLGLNGYLQFSSADLLPTLFYWGFPLTAQDGLFSDPIRVFSAADWGQLWNGVATPDPTLGAIGMIALDCFGQPAPGITFSLSNADAGAPALYYVSGQSLVSLPNAMTDANGIALFIDVPPGPVDVVATPAAVGAVSSRVHVHAVAGALTEVVLEPTP